MRLAQNRGPAGRGMHRSLRAGYILRGLRLLVRLVRASLAPRSVEDDALGPRAPEIRAWRRRLELRLAEIQFHARLPL